MRFSASMASKYILHVDADAFFASVEQALNPELKGRPVIVGGGDRGVVSAASYEARRFGIKSAMPVSHARRRCPQGIFLYPNFEMYKLFSSRMFEIMEEYSPLVEATSIDEGYIDLTGTLRLHRAPPWEVAHRILSSIKSSLGINVSGGLAPGRCWAKLATGVAKPNGLLYLEPHNAMNILGPLPAAKIPGVGTKADETLKNEGIRTISDILSAGRGQMRSLLGQWGERLVEMASGRDDRPLKVDSDGNQKSYSKERTLEKDTSDPRFIRALARELAQKLTAKLRLDGKGASTVTLKLRYSDFTDTSRSVSRCHPTSRNADILESIDELLPRTFRNRGRIRQVGVKLSGIDLPVFQEDLFDPKGHLSVNRDEAIDRIRKRFGFGAVRVFG
jgi:DNA polymerase IV